MTTGQPATPGSVVYNYAQLEGIWIQAGGPATAAPIAAAIAMAESGGNTTATNNDSNGTVDRGLWQINSVHGDTQSTYDVMGNARAAVAISNQGQNWSPWVTYNNGRYQAFLQTNVPPDTSAPINGTNAQVNQSTANLTANTGPLIGGLKDPFNWFLNPIGSIEGIAGGAANQATGDVGSFLVKFALQGLIVTILNPFIQLIAGVLGIAAGGTMVALGLFVMVRNTETGQQAERGIGSAAQLGMSLAAPETKAETIYSSGGKETARVQQTRRQSGRVNIGGRPIQYRPARVRTDVMRPDTARDLRTEASSYPGGETERTTRNRPYGRGPRMGPPRPVQTSGNGKK